MGAEEIEWRAHVELARVCAPHQREVDGRAAGMRGAFGDVTLLEQVALGDVGIEFRLALDIVDPLRPAQEMRHRALRPVAVEHFQTKSARGEITRNRDERVCRRGRQQAARTLVAVDSRPHEIVIAEIAHVDDEALDHRGGIDESLGSQRLALRRPRREQDEGERNIG